MDYRKIYDALIERAQSRIITGYVEKHHGGVCPDCGEEIHPETVRGEDCENCGHVFNWGDAD